MVPLNSDPLINLVGKFSSLQFACHIFLEYVKWQQNLPLAIPKETSFLVNFLFWISRLSSSEFIHPVQQVASIPQLIKDLGRKIRSG
jgi:hypothetical protein